ncbi:YfaZ family outer membrane protein [Pectobacteriaceae bacterium CE90]|nr:YfaZ family outer membrane protein [Prodigiosinella sp. LS101]WJV55118.1 YfaZ family outer membrane protein [Prodigiosinella sp. LS101]WJV59478.1 YfaZ family outer membrane protein [Pectobacteriaceae bacterium C111]WJY13991.1 YfaZ family outer membrane protein [Pectobacteriaceae bacterium CE90]
MKKFVIACAGSLLLATASAQAVSVSGEAGSDYVGASAGFGLPVPGLSGNVGWGHNSDHSNDSYSLGLGYTFSLSNASLTVGAKGVYMNQNHFDDGYGVALGGGLQIPLNSSFSLYGEGYYSPDAFSSHVDHYVEAKAGVRWQVFRPLSVDVGYRYINMASGESDNDNKVADTAYVGLGLSF